MTLMDHRARTHTHTLFLSPSFLLSADQPLQVGVKAVLDQTLALLYVFYHISQPLRFLEKRGKPIRYSCKDPWLLVNALRGA